MRPDYDDLPSLRVFFNFQTTTSAPIEQNHPERGHTAQEYIYA